MSQADANPGARPRVSWFARLVGNSGPSGPPIASVDSIAERRRFFDSSGLRIDPPAHLEVLPEVLLRERRGAQLTAEIIRPSGGTPPWPLVLYLHGGAWCVWSAGQVRRITFALAERGCVVISLNYGLAPELPFPCAVEDAIYGARWAARNAQEFGAEPARLALAGDSSGANLAAAAAVFLNGHASDLINEGDLTGVPVRIAAALLLCGVYDFAARIVEPPTTPGTTEIMSNLAYLGPHFLAHHRDPLVSPARAPNLDRFPPTYLCCGDRDSALPQSLLMAEALAAAGVGVTLAVVAGADHEFLLMDPAANPWVARELARSCDWLLARLR